MTIGCGFKVSFSYMGERHSFVYAIDPSHDTFLVYCDGKFKWIHKDECKLYVGL